MLPCSTPRSSAWLRKSTAHRSIGWIRLQRITLARALRAALHVVDRDAEVAALRAEIAELQDVLRLTKAALQEARAERNERERVS